MRRRSAAERRKPIAVSLPPTELSISPSTARIRGPRLRAATSSPSYRSSVKRLKHSARQSTLAACKARRQREQSLRARRRAMAGWVHMAIEMLVHVAVFQRGRLFTSQPTSRMGARSSRSARHRQRRSQLGVVTSKPTGVSLPQPSGRTIASWTQSL
jgi:hypothetical protein